MNIYRLGGLSIFNAWSFFKTRYDFLKSNFDRSGQTMFSFKIWNHDVVAMRGDNARKVFFVEKGLGFADGYTLLMGSVPSLENITVGVVGGEVEEAVAFAKRLQIILRRDRLQDAIPLLLSDLCSDMDALGDEGRINPFNVIYNLVFQMTVRMATCKELADDRKSVAKMNDLFNALEGKASPFALLFGLLLAPWFPGATKKHKEEATRELYEMISSYVDARRKADVPNSDAIDMLIADGSDNPTVVGFILSTIFAGINNTGMVCCWMLLHLGTNNKWRSEATTEIQHLIDTYTDAHSSEPIHQRLSTIPIAAWEDEMPVMDLIIRETLRLIQNGTALRRNLVDDLEVGEKHINKGAFMAYNLGDVHLDERIYKEPFKFDPERFCAPREEDKNGELLFLAWGAGRHPCQGMKVAKLEAKVMMALFLARYEFKVVDASGHLCTKLPQPNRNDIHKARPVGEPCYLQFKTID
jgi:sterol 14-demethylase